MIPIPDVLFRLLGYGGLALVALLRLTEAPSSGVWLLLLFTLIWPALWCAAVRTVPLARQPGSAIARLAHAMESLVITAVVTLAGLGFWLSVAVGLLCLTGVTALGGLPMLIPSALAIGLWFALAGWAGVLAQPADGWAMVGGLLASGFLLGLAWLSFARIRRLDAHRRSALSESATLRDRNARLARYLPGELPPSIVSEPRALQRPQEQFATVAFVDVVGFTALVASRPVMELSEVLNDFLSTVVTLTERHGGVVGKFLGDGVLIYFADGPDRPAAERWRGAVACARVCLQLGPALDGLARAWRQRGLTIELSVRAGMASGCCAIGDWGGSTRLDYTLIGTPVNLASRLQAHAEPGTLVLTSATAALLGADGALAARLEGLGCRQVRGIGPVVMHALSASAKVRASPPPAVPAAPSEAP
ncbi:MAG TPA: adenylate/guanylate cyclase domain-containing protein [Pseudomonadales bacterium]